MKDDNLLKEALKKYKKSNYYIQSWSEYKKELLFPWESIDEEWEIVKNSSLVAEFDLA